MNIGYRTQSSVELVSSMGDDRTIVRAARVSTGNVHDGEAEGLIRYLVRHRHATPLEHCTLTVKVETPIFVAREFMRHRVVSFNETSARYRPLDPVFWVPGDGRKMGTSGSSARPTFEISDENAALVECARATIAKSAESAWESYTTMLDAGVPREVARAALPVGVFTSFYATSNLRGWLAFLSLRVHDAEAAVVSYPQQEIEDVARQIETLVAGKFPLAHKAFEENGRVI